MKLRYLQLFLDCNIGSRVLLILYISTDLESFWVFMLCFSTKLQLIKVSVTLEFMSMCMDKSFDISVVSTEIDRYKEVLQTLRALIVGH